MFYCNFVTMQVLQKSLKVFFVAIFILSISLSSYSETQNTNDIYFKKLKQELINSGFYSPDIMALYNNEKLLFDSEGIGSFFVHNEGTLDYETFDNKTSIW